MKRALLIGLLILAQGPQAFARGHMRAGRATAGAPAICGNGRVQGSEACDDGNTTSGDGCSSVCALESGFTCATPGSACTFDNANSFLFDGTNESVSVADNNSLDFTNHFTISGWFREATVATSKRLIAKFNTSNFSFHVGKHTTDPNRFRIFISSDGNATDFCEGAVDAAGVTDNAWYHLTVVYDGTLSGNTNRLKVYVNGAAVDMSSCTGTIPSSMFVGTANLTFAVSQHSLDNYFAGNIDEITAWNVSLSAANAFLLATIGQDPRLVNSGTGLVSWWRFGDTVPAGGGTDSATGTVYDKIGSNNGTPSNLEVGDEVSAVPP